MKKVRATGIGVHSPEEIIQMGKDDLKVLADMLGDKTFFFGDEPTQVRIFTYSKWLERTEEMKIFVIKLAYFFNVFFSHLFSLTSWFSLTSLNWWS